MRPTVDEYFMQVARTVATRSSCTRGQVGAVLVLQGRVISTGYNGTAAGTRNCSDGGCQRCLDRNAGLLGPGESKDRCVCAHAEENAVVQAARFGVAVSGAWLYTTRDPCPSCARMVVNAGVDMVVAASEVEDLLAVGILQQALVPVRVVAP